MQRGTIKKLTDRGFGFITPDEGGEDIFFHCSEVQPNKTEFDSLNEGEHVTYEKGEGKGDRPKAVNVTVV